MNIEHWWNDTGRETPKCSERNLSAQFCPLLDSKHNGLGSNTSLRSKKPETNQVVSYLVS